LVFSPAAFGRGARDPARETRCRGELVERLFPGAPQEMTTVYHREGADLALTHYCAGGNQPRMRARAPAADANVLEFAFDGGTNLDPAAIRTCTAREGGDAARGGALSGSVICLGRAGRAARRAAP
jgi:hypothetical protein